MRLTLLALFVACNGGSDSDPVPEADADTDADADSDVDTDTDADTDIPVGLDCTPGAYPTPDPGAAGAGECITETLVCGQTIQATQVGGSTSFGTENGENLWMCSGSAEGQDFAGPERVYRIAPPAGVNALEVRVQACEPTWLLWHRLATSCPPLGGGGITCDYAINGGDYDPWEAFLVGQQGQVHLIVEPFQNQGGNFELTVDCYDDQGNLVE